MKKTLKFTKIILILSIFIFSPIFCNNNWLLTPPSQMSETDIKEIEQIWNAEGIHFVFHSQFKNAALSLFYQNGSTSFRLEVYENLPEELTEAEKAKFTITTNHRNEKLVTIFTYEYGNYSQKVTEQPETDVDDYFFAKPLNLKKYHPIPTLISIEDLAEIIRNKKVIFYTGAGISATSNVPTLNILAQNIKIETQNNESNQISFFRSILNNPEDIASTFTQFCLAMFSAPPTLAHRALANIATIKQAQIITENFDLLQERSCVKPTNAYHCKSENKIKEKWLKDIDAIICIGLSKDNSGFLGWYKKHNPNGKIIAIDLEQPSYLGNKDMFLQGDIQENIDLLEKYLKSGSGRAFAQKRLMLKHSRHKSISNFFC